MIRGIGKFIDSQGLPLQFVLDELNKENCLVDWIDFIEYTIEKNWKVTQTMSKIEEGLMDVFGKEYTHEVINRLRYYLIQKYKDLSC